MFYGLIAIAGITGILAMRTNFPLFRFGAAIPWLGLIAYIASYYSGENWTVIAILGCVVMMCAFPLMQLGRDVKRNKDFSSGFETEEHSGFSFRIPDWLKGNESNNETIKRNRDADIEDYRARVRKAVRNTKNNSRRKS